MEGMMNRIFNQVEAQIRFQVLLEERQMHVSRITSAAHELREDYKRTVGYQEPIVLPGMRSLQD